MSRNGIPTLQTLRILYSRSGGSSSGVREYISSQLPAFQTKHPHVQVETKSAGNTHPFLYAMYTRQKLGRHGKPIPWIWPLRNKTAAETAECVERVRTQWGSGTKDRTIRRYTKHPTVQGLWSPLRPLDYSRTVTRPMSL